MMVMWHTLGPGKLTLELETKSCDCARRIMTAKLDRRLFRD